MTHNSLKMVKSPVDAGIQGHCLLVKLTFVQFDTVQHVFVLLTWIGLATPYTLIKRGQNVDKEMSKGVQYVDKERSICG